MIEGAEGAVNRVLDAQRSVVDPVIAHVKGVAGCVYGVQACAGLVWSGVFFWCGGWCFWVGDPLCITLSEDSSIIQQG